MSIESRSGSCNCGRVSYQVTGPMREIVACHCGQCRKQSGLYYAATNAADSDLVVNDSGSLKWYAASDFAKRGFCGECGSALFWKANDSVQTSIIAGSLDAGSGLKIERHIFCADKGDFYEIADGLPQFDYTDRDVT